MGQAIGLNKPNSYRLIAVTISNNEGSSWDVSNLVDSFEINESIYQMFLTGSISIFDNMNIFARVNFTGQEYIRIHFAGIQGNEEEVPEDEHINQVFRIFNVSNYLRDTSENLSHVMYKLDLCSPLLYEAKTKRLSRMYRGKSGDILNKICKEELNFIEQKDAAYSIENDSKPLTAGGKELGNFFSVFDSDVGEVSGFLAPNWSVHRVLEHLRDSTSDDSNQPYGNSYYFYQTALDGFRFCNIDTMQNIVYLDGGVEFAPRDSGAELPEIYDDEVGVGNDILSYNKVDSFDTLLGHQDALYAGKIVSYDTISKQITYIDSQFTQQFEIGDDGTYKKELLSVAPSFRVGAEGIRVPDDGGAEGEVMPPAPIAVHGDPIIERFGAAVNFNYNQSSAFSNKIETSGGSLSSGGTHTVYNRARVERLFDLNRINIQLSGRTNISAGMVIQVDIPMPTQIGGEHDEIQHNGRLLIEGITWKGNRDGLETQLSCTTDGFQVNPDTWEGLGLSQQY